jgi:hypothetical protein
MTICEDCGKKIEGRIYLDGIFRVCLSCWERKGHHD